MTEVIVIDDSPLMQRVLSDAINRIDDFKVVATAIDAFEARDLIKKYEPDLVTIDINMPKMDGVSFLRNLMRLHPMPAVVISTDASKHLEVFDDGAVGFVAKKEIGESDESFFSRLEDTLLRLNFLIDRYKSKKTRKQPAQLEIEKSKLHPDELIAHSPAKFGGKPLIAIGASTGGVETLMTIFNGLQPPLAPILITLHIPFGFSGSFAERLDRLSSLTVHEAVDGEPVLPSHAYLAPGNKHMTVVSDSAGNYKIKLIDGPRISRHKPSVDVLMRSVTNTVGSSALGIMLTGMGDDGMIGMKELYDTGAHTIAQDEKSCVVFGMPSKVIEAGGAKEILPLDKIAGAIMSYRKR